MTVHITKFLVAEQLLMFFSPFTANNAIKNPINISMKMKIPCTFALLSAPCSYFAFLSLSVCVYHFINFTLSPGHFSRLFRTSKRFWGQRPYERPVTRSACHQVQLHPQLAQWDEKIILKGRNKRKMQR